MDAWRAYLREVAAHLEALRAMGISDLVLPEGMPVEPPARAQAAPATPRLDPASPVRHAPPPPARSAPAPRPAQPATVPAPAPARVGPTVTGDGSLAAVQAALAGCTRCRLSEGRKNIVFGVGNPQADLMFIGEGPGADEDRTGEPFVGAAGQMLTKIIGAMGLSRDDVYIANVVKCRPPENRTPFVDEIEQCYPYLRKQIEAVNPKVIVTLGGPAAQTIIGVTTGITRLRGTWCKYGSIPVMPTFHPSYIIREQNEQALKERKKLVWEDMQKVMAKLGLPAPLPKT